MCSLKCIFCCQ